jgi:hypothetical protein
MGDLLDINCGEYSALSTLLYLKSMIAVIAIRKSSQRTKDEGLRTKD